jgi:hypothetical protein
MGKNGNAGCSGCIYLWPNLFLLAFVIMKLVGVIDWSWWWVLSPLWAEIGLIIACILVIIAAYAYDAYLMKHDATYRLSKNLNAYMRLLTKTK